MKKRIYVVYVRFKNNGRYLKANLYAYTNEQDAIDYCDYKSANKTPEEIEDNSTYQYEELVVLDKKLF